MSVPKLLTEFVGTFFLVLTIGLTAVSELQAAPLAIGATLMVMVYMGGHVSGAHYNPAVSVAVLIRGKLAPRDLGPYITIQLLGAVAAGVVVRVITGETFAAAPGATASPAAAFFIEALFTFALALVILNVATSERTAGNSYYGLAIGFTVMAGAYAGGGISGGAFNPAVGLGPMLVDVVLGDGSFTHAWLYVVGPLVGGVAAAVAFRAQDRAA